MNFVGIKDIIGKTITGVVYKESNENPSCQLFLILSDGKWFEFYTIRGASIIPTHSSYPGGLDGARKYLSPTMEITFESYIEGDKIVTHEF
jgi:hypothetical protein